MSEKRKTTKNKNNNEQINEGKNMQLSNNDNSVLFFWSVAWLSECIIISLPMSSYNPHIDVSDVLD